MRPILGVATFLVFAVLMVTGALLHQGGVRLMSLAERLAGIYERWN